MNLHASDVIELRGGAEAVRGHVVHVTDAGVRIRPETGAARTISWDRVRSVEASSSLHQRDAAQYVQLAEDLWRARTRLERGDAAMAEPLLEKHAARYLGATAEAGGETALVVMEGLLRCRLERGSRAEAMIPALEAARLRAAGVATHRNANLPAVIDHEKRLCPLLPPVWAGVEEEALARLERELVAYRAQGDEVIAAVAAVYLHSVRRALSKDVSGGRRDSIARAIRHPGVEFLRDLESCAQGQRAARTRLERRVTTGLPQWAEAWARYSIGTAMLRERDEANRLRGALHLVHLPARFGSTQPYLAGLALAHLAQFHEANGDEDGAESLREELAWRFPDVVGIEPSLIIIESSEETADEHG